MENTEHFGLWAICPPDAKVAWGARAILNDGQIDLVWDRQSWRGSESPEREAFAAVLNKALREARRECLRLWHRGVIRRDQNNLVVLYAGPGCQIRADTRGSYGYLYMIAYPFEADEQTVPEPLEAQQPKRCGVYYPAHECGVAPKSAKFVVNDRGAVGSDYYGLRVRYFASRKAAQRHCAKRNREAFSPRDYVYPDEVRKP
jgi:hypothetical protein